MTYRAWNLKTLDRAAVRELTHAIAEQNTEELEYHSQSEEPWTEAQYNATLAAQQKETALLAGILAARGITNPTEALTLLAGEEELTDPMLLTDMDKACARILQAIDNEETIVVFGDYDVDGVTATALLYQHLKGMGANVKCMLPSREGDGYGLSKNAIQSIHDKGCQLIVTVDNGIAAIEEAEFAASLGVDLIVTDHHLPHEVLPKAVAVVDPRRADDTSPFKGLCGAGVAFKLCAALDGCPPEEMLDYCGDLAAVGTVADVMPLTGENRTLVKAGLRQLQQTDRPGLMALLEEVGLAGKPVTAENVSYAIAPRINAAGRMDSAVTALQLVLCEDEDRAAELAHRLTEINVSRQETEQEIVKAAQELLDREPGLLEDRVILLWGQNWHPGVIGIVASRLVEKTGRPVIVVSIDENGEGKGSGRSVQGFNLHECIASCADLLLRFGGHAMAAGLSVRAEKSACPPPPDERLGGPGVSGAVYPAAGVRPLHPAGPGHGGKRSPAGSAGPLWRREPHPGVPAGKSRGGGHLPGLGGKALPPAPAAGECQHLRGLVRDALRSSCPTPWAMSWMPPSTSRCTNRPGARSSPAASSSCTRRGWATPWPSRPRWCRPCAGAPRCRTNRKSLSLPCAVRSSRCTGSFRPAAGTRKTCSLCSPSLASSRREKLW